MRQKILRHSFPKDQGLIFRHLTNLTSDENTLKGELPNQIAEGRNTNVPCHNYQLHS